MRPRAMAEPSKKDLLRRFLKGIETGDAMAAAVVNEARYIQHNPQTHEGSEGIAALFARLSGTNPRVTFCRVFQDGDFAFAHNEYDFASCRAAFEVFRFENNQAVEHWDNIQPLQPPNPSGRGMLEGADQITDLHLTETNRALIRDYVSRCLIGGDHPSLAHYVAPDLIQHSPRYGDGAQALSAALQDPAQGGVYQHLHRVLAEGNFVLSMSEGQLKGAHTSFYDLHRIADGRIVEHWDTVETVPPRSEWKNDNGKF